MKRRTFIQTGVATLAAQSLPAVSTQTQTEDPPNMIYMLCDDLGYGDLSCYGHPIIQTPHIDRLASEGIRFTDCYSAAPVCSPARAGVLTGRTPHRCCIPDWIPTNSPTCLQHSEISVARLMKDKGYATAHCGKWHLNGVMDGSQPTPGSHGFDHWFSTQNNASPTHKNPTNFVRNGEEVGEMVGYSSEIIAEETIAWMKANQSRPFCIFVWFHSPHEPIASGPDFMERYADINEETRREYYGNVTQTDHAVGMIMNALGELKLDEKTLVMFTSDNGPETLNRYRGSHRSHGSPGDMRAMKLHLYEGGIRVPGIARWTGTTPAGVENETPISGVDVLPTFCDLAGLTPPSDRAIDGTSIAPLLRNEAFKRDRALYWRYDKALSQPKIALRDGDWKLLVDSPFQNYELYNLRDDPQETTNVMRQNPTEFVSLKDQLITTHFDVENDPVSQWKPWRRR